MTDTHFPETPTYTDRRHTETVTVVDREGDTITTDAGWSWIAHRTMQHVTQGTVLLVETHNVSQVCGVAVEDEPDEGSGVGWLFRHSDQKLRAEWAELRNDHAVQRARTLAAQRGEWQRRQDALPSWLRERLQWFHLRGGEHFAQDGWSYELVICELAALYAADEDWVGQSLHGTKDALGQSKAEEPEAVMQMARDFGTSGNQHGMAQSLALAHAQDPSRSFAGTVSAMSPLTGDPDYGGGQDQPVLGTVEERLDGAGGYVEVHLQVDDDGNEAVLVHPLTWVQNADPDAVSAYGQSALDALNAAGLLQTSAT